MSLLSPSPLRIGGFLIKRGRGTIIMGEHTDFSTAEKIHVFIDYENARRLARRQFLGVSAPPHSGMVHPVKPGELLANRRTRLSTLAKVSVFRGRPVPQHQPTASQFLICTPQIGVGTRGLKLPTAISWMRKISDRSDKTDWPRRTRRFRCGCLPQDAYPSSAAP